MGDEIADGGVLEEVRTQTGEAVEEAGGEDWGQDRGQENAAYHLLSSSFIMEYAAAGFSSPSAV